MVYAGGRVVFGTGVDVTDVVDVSVVNVSYSLFDIDRLVVARSRRAVQVATVALSNVTSDLDEVPCCCYRCSVPLLNVRTGPAYVVRR